MPDDNTQTPLPGTDLVPYEDRPAPAKDTITPAAKMLRLYRAGESMDQKQLAAAIGIPASTLSSIERGRSVEWPSAVKVLTWMFGGVT